MKLLNYDTLNVKLSYLPLNKLKSWIKNVTQVTSNLPSNAVGEWNDDSNFTYKLLSTDTQI